MRASEWTIVMGGVVSPCHTRCEMGGNQQTDQGGIKELATRLAYQGWRDLNSRNKEDPVRAVWLFTSTGKTTDLCVW